MGGNAVHAITALLDGWHSGVGDDRHAETLANLRGLTPSSWFSRVILLTQRALISSLKLRKANSLDLGIDAAVWMARAPDALDPLWRCLGCFCTLSVVLPALQP